MERIAELYRIEKEARGSPPDEPRRRRQAEAAPLLADLEARLAAQLTRISGKSPLGEPIRHALTRLKWLRPYLDHRVLEADNSIVERSVLGIAVGRKNFLIVGSPNGGKSAAISYTAHTLIEMAVLNGVASQAWLADVLGRTRFTRLDELLPRR